MGRKYTRSPIMEVVCEIHFGTDSEWDMTVPGLIYERVRDIFPKKRQVKAVSIKLPLDSGPSLRATERIQFLSEDGSSFIQVSPHVLAVNHLNPYPFWETFSSLIQQGFDTYCDVIQPNTIERIGLRYINKIPFEEREIELEKFFNFYPFVGSRLPKKQAAFFVGIQIPFTDGRDILKIELSHELGEQTEGVSIILDLDYTLIHPGSIDLEHTLDWINEAHQSIEDAFEACITDVLREKFGKEGE